MTMQRSLILIALLITASWQMTAGGKGPITLKLGRMLKVTDTYLYTTRFSDQQQMLTRLPTGQVLDSTTSRSVELVAVATVNFVTLEGEEREKTLKIRSFKVTVDGVSQNYLHTGAVVRCVFSNDSGSVFTMDGKSLPDSVTTILSEVLHAEGGAKTGRILDPKKAVKPGDSWSMNIKELLRTVEGDALRIDKKNIKSTVRLVAIDSTKEDGELAVVLGEARAKRVKLGGMNDLNT
jgi:hypothetical protein